MHVEALAHVEHEIKARGKALLRFGHVHQQLAAEQTIRAIVCFAGKIELRGEHAAARRLHLDVKVAGPPFVGRRHDGEKAIAACGIGELMAAQPEAGVVIDSLGISLPEIDERVLHRPAAAGQDETGELD